MAGPWQDYQMPPPWLLYQPPPPGSTTSTPSATGQRPTVPLADKGSDIARNIFSDTVIGLTSLAGAPGSIASGAGSVAGWASGVLGKTPAEQEAIGNQVRRAVPVLGALPNVGEVAQGVNRVTGWQPYQPQSDEARYMGAPFKMAPAAIAGALTMGTSVPLALGGAVAGGLMSEGGGDVAASQFGEQYRPAGQLAGGIVGNVAPMAATRQVANAMLKSGATPTPKIFEAGDALFKAARAEGVTIKPDVMDDILRRVIDVGKRNGADPGIEGTRSAAGAIARLEKEMSGGQVAPGLQSPGKAFDDVMTLRQILREAQGPTGGKAATAMKAEFDNAVNGLGANDVIGPNPARAVELLNQARPLWQQASKAREIDDIFRVAGEERQRLDKPGVYEEALRRGFGKLASDENFKKFWTPDEQAAIITASTGGGLPSQLLRRIGQSKLVDVFGVIPVNPLRGAGNVGSRGAADVASALVRSNPNPFLSPVTVPKTVQQIAAALAALRSPEEFTSPQLLNVPRRP